MKKELKEMLTKQTKLLDENPFTEEDFKVLAQFLKGDKGDKDFMVRKGDQYDKAVTICNQLEAFDYNPILVEHWALDAGEEYDYYAIMFGSFENLALLINEELDLIEQVILNWRYNSAK